MMHLHFFEQSYYQVEVFLKCVCLKEVHKNLVFAELKIVKGVYWLWCHMVFVEAAQIVC